MERPSKKIDRDNQLDLFERRPSRQPSTVVKSDSGRSFEHPDRNEIYLGFTPLKQHLQSVNIVAPMIITEILDELDWMEFETAYPMRGRPPYAPSLMVGMILYGILQKKSSLRELERFARSDLGCMWASGGIQPDHSAIGRFIQLHGELLSGDFFIQLTRKVLTKTRTGIQHVAGDGTIIESAGSSYHLLKEESAREYVKKKVAQAEANPEDLDLQASAERAKRVQQKLIERQEKRRLKGKNADGIKICPTDLDAYVQPAKKTKAQLPSYKPSVMANEGRVITGFTVDPSNEIKVVEELLSQTTQLSDKQVECLLLDAGYHADEIINLAKSKDITLLCPRTSKLGKDLGPAQRKKYLKRDFQYDAQTDRYICPNGQHLTLKYSRKGGAAGRSHSIYSTRACADCPLKSQCTTSSKGREVKRYATDTDKEELDLQMSYPEAKELYRKRQAMVEPVFSMMRGSLGLSRFKRRGLKSVRTEFGLYALAYNISRVVAYILIFLVYFMLNKAIRSHLANFYGLNASEKVFNRAA